MRFYLIFGLLISVLFVVFILQNTPVVSTSFLFWNFSGSLAVTILLSFAFGVVVSLLLAIPIVFKRRKKKKIDPTVTPEIK